MIEATATSTADFPPARHMSRLVRVIDGLLRLPALAALFLIRLYQRTLSPALPALFGPACGCRFAPTCSHYAAEAIRTHGAIIGIALGAIRLVKCTPLHPGGFDPVPPRRGRPICRGAAPRTTLVTLPLTGAPPSGRSSSVG